MLNFVYWYNDEFAVFKIVHLKSRCTVSIVFKIVHSTFLKTSDIVLFCC